MSGNNTTTEKYFRRTKELLDNAIWDRMSNFSFRVPMGDDAIELIQEKIAAGSTILEFGSGQSTQILAQDYNMVSVENNPKYVDLVKGVEYIYAPYKPFKSEELDRVIKWYDPMILKERLTHDYDLIIVDGPNAELGRYGIKQFHKFLGLDPGKTPMLFDDMQVPFIYMTALLMVQEHNLSSIDIHLAKGSKVFAWISTDKKEEE